MPTFTLTVMLPSFRKRVSAPFALGLSDFSTNPRIHRLRVSILKVPTESWIFPSLGPSSRYVTLPDSVLRSETALRRASFWAAAGSPPSCMAPSSPPERSRIGAGMPQPASDDSDSRASEIAAIPGVAPGTRERILATGPPPVKLHTNLPRA